MQVSCYDLILYIRFWMPRRELVARSRRVFMAIYLSWQRADMRKRIIWDICSPNSANQWQCAPSGFNSAPHRYQVIGTLSDILYPTLISVALTISSRFNRYWDFDVLCENRGLQNNLAHLMRCRPPDLILARVAARFAYADFMSPLLCSALGCAICLSRSYILAAAEC